MINWTLEHVAIKLLKPYAKNPRQISKDNADRLSENLDKFGLIDKPILNRDYTVIGGHQRIKILKKKKVKEIQCWVPDVQLSEQEVEELCIGLNLHQGKWDYDILANEWETLDLLQYGFSEEQLLGTCKDAEEVESEEEEEKPKSSSKKMKCCPNCGFEF